MAPFGHRKKGKLTLYNNIGSTTWALDELQVIAYGTTTKWFNTGNVATVKAADIEKQPVNNPLFALQGLVPGLVVIFLSFLVKLIHRGVYNIKWIKCLQEN